jgi:hypothetical protein
VRGDGATAVTDRHDHFATARASCKRILRDNPDADVFQVKISRTSLQLFYEWLQSTDPDMPAPAICKALGPLVGDDMMNTKLHRLDQLADTLGPLTVRLAMAAEQLEQRR